MHQHGVILGQQHPINQQLEIIDSQLQAFKMQM